MAADLTKAEVTFWRSYGRPAPPEKISQEAFEFNDRHLRRLAKLRPGERPTAADLFEYTEDLRYTPIQSSLLAYVLPFCLQVWRDDLRGIDSGYGGFVENFYPVLADLQIFEEHLSPKQTAAVAVFMRQTILEEIDDQRGLAYQGSKARPLRWIRAMTTYGVLLPDVDRLWAAWLSLDTLGRAIAAVQYLSCLMYPKNENPVFAPWTPNGGGGPPCLWDFEGHLYTHRWLQPNVNYLRGFLNAARVHELLTRAFEYLGGQPEHDVAALIKDDFPLLVETVQARCAELPRLLETTQEPSRDFEWPT
jgi:hypothetical protein